ncbi:Potassium voltage-gated channel sub S member 1 [Entophlyctis sp. JEL0112]|nr:Potassium voltage-gated channel sub S member 1 [Entophlyctis sp. JEL0112]
MERALDTACDGGHSDDEDDDLETVLEAYLKDLLAATERMPPWLARTFIRQCAGRLVSLRMLDPAVISAAYLSLPPAAQTRFAQLKLSAPLTVARAIMLSKLQNAFHILVILTSIALLCIETDPKLTISDLTVVFALEILCALVFLVDIAVQTLFVCSGWPDIIRTSFSRLRHSARKSFEVSVLSYRKASQISRGNKHIPKISLSNAMSDGDSAINVSNAAQNGSEFINHQIMPQKKQIQLQYVDNVRIRLAWLCIDVIATLPFVAEVVVYSLVAQNADFTTVVQKLHSWDKTSDLIRVSRLCRILRLFKLVQKSDVIRTAWRAVAHSVDEIYTLFTLITLVVMFFSFILFYVEISQSYFNEGVWYYSYDGTVARFQTIADCFWVMIVTLSTVGYGDVVPVTVAGKIVMSIVMFLSLFIVAFPLCMITMQFSHYANHIFNQKKQHLDAARKLRKRLSKTDETIIFHRQNTAKIIDDPEVAASDALANCFEMQQIAENTKVRFDLDYCPPTSSSSSSVRDIQEAARQPRHQSGVEAERDASVLSGIRDLNSSGKNPIMQITPTTASADNLAGSTLPLPRTSRAVTLPNLQLAGHSSVDVSARTHRRRVHLRVREWRVEYNAERREEVLHLVLQLRDEQSFKKLLKALSD